MPPKCARRDGTLFIQPPGPEDGKGPGTGTESRAGWVARIADRSRRGEALAAERRVEDLHAVLRMMDLPNAHCGSVCLEPVGDLGAIREEIWRADVRRLRRHTTEAAFAAALVAVGAVLVVLGLAL